MLRKTGVLAVSLLVLAASVTGAAARSPRAKRIETGTYVAGGVYGVAGVMAFGTQYVGAVRLPAGDEKFLSVEISDGSGQPILAEVTQSVAGDITPEVVYDVCGASDEPLRVEPDVEVVVYLYIGVCEGKPSVPTSGTVTGTFSFRK